MTWNLWWRFGPWEKRQRAIIDIIRSSGADVVCLQEVWVDAGDDLAAIIAEELGYHSVRTAPIGRGVVGFANAVLSRWPLELIADEALPRCDGTPGHRRVVAATVESPWGRWPIASTHLDHRFDDSATRELQARRVLELAQAWRGDPTIDLPVVIGADLNAVADSDEVRLLTGRRDGIAGIVLSDAWEQVGDGPGFTWRRGNPHTADSAWPNRRLDYVLVSWPRPKPVGNPSAARLVGTAAVEVDGEPVWASDHAGVVVDLVTPS
ncbi:MAG TPA: endonuclease/exonuclease/phosphatase family protein [Ilumatobacteraceae bacterium]|nr:endonuclease/exonuclease/phosphatase family protein [Ilumatobacteraceae bacterium]